MREHNEDAFLLLPDAQLAVVADGMGGHQAGDVASRITIETLEEDFGDATPMPARGFLGLFRRRSEGSDRLADSVRRANKAILDFARDRPECRGMGTTVVSLWAESGMLHYAHVGDSRLYRLRDGLLAQLTADHSLVNEYIRLGQLTPEQARHFPYKNVIVRALGLSPGVEVDTDTSELRAGDRYLLCSDGLTDLVEDETIRLQLAQIEDLDAAAAALVELALEAGGLDNVTAVVAYVEEDP